MDKRVIFSDGGKGGVGKSIVSIALVDYLLTKDGTTLLIDADTTNPDVERLFHAHPGVIAQLYDLRDEDDVFSFLSVFEEQADNVDTVVINLPACFDFSQHMDTAIELFKALQFEVWAFFTINRQADSINLLGNSLTRGLLSRVDAAVVVRNGFFGADHVFERFEESKAKTQLLQQGGQVIYLPELFHRSLDQCLLEKKITFSEASRHEIQLVYRFQIGRWIASVHQSFDRVFAHATGQPVNTSPSKKATQSTPEEAAHESE